jgi:PAS domain S-box-containing protein
MLKEENTHELRCRSCKKLLAKKRDLISNYEIKCIRCGTLNFVFSDNKDQIILTDPDGIILYANDLLETVTGYSLKEVLGQKPSVWGGLMPKSFYKEMWINIKDKKKSIQVEVKNKRKNGELYDAQLTISPILDTKGEIKFFIGIETLIINKK